MPRDEFTPSLGGIHPLGWRSWADSAWPLPPVQPPVAPLPPLPELYNPRVAELERKVQETTLREPPNARVPRVGQRVWLTRPFERFDLHVRYIHRKDDVGIVVSLKHSGGVAVLFRNSCYRHVRNRAVEPTYTNRRARIPISFLRLTDPKTPAVTGRDPLLIELAALRTAHPGLIAKQLHELVSITPAPSLSLVKKALSRLAKEGRESRCLLSIPIEIDILLEIAAALPISDLLALTATCRELRNSLEDVRLTRTKGLIVKYHEKMRRDSNIAVWN